MRVLVAVPTYNEEKYVERVMTRIVDWADTVLVIDDGSTDLTPCHLPKFPVEVIRHAENRGYGRSMQDAFRWAKVDGFDWVITMDCDEQHEPEQLPDFMAAIKENRWDIVSGSRYLSEEQRVNAPPENRRKINMMISQELNDRLGSLFHTPITDAFCGFKAYRVEAISRLKLDVDGYAFPLQFWVQAAAHGLRLGEIPVKLIYNDPERTFGGPLNVDEVRLAHYREVLHRELDTCKSLLPVEAVADLVTA